MKTKLSFTVTSAIAMLLSACGMTIVSGSGEIVEETRDVRAYSQVVFSAPGELTITQNGRESLIIEADDNLLQYIKTSVEDNVLHIEVVPGAVQLYPSRPIRYRLDVDALTNVTLNGSGDIRSDSLLVSTLDFDLNGSGNILVGDLKTQSTKLVLNGSGRYSFGSLMTGQLAASLHGSGHIAVQEAIVKTTNVEINGSGSYQAHDLQSQVVSVSVIGSGGGNIWATDELSINITGSGDVQYRGQPAITETITGSGDLIKTARQ